MKSCILVKHFLNLITPTSLPFHIVACSPPIRMFVMPVVLIRGFPDHKAGNTLETHFAHHALCHRWGFVKAHEAGYLVGNPDQVILLSHFHSLHLTQIVAKEGLVSALAALGEFLIAGPHSAHGFVQNILRLRRWWPIHQVGKSHILLNIDALQLPEELRFKGTKDEPSFAGLARAAGSTQPMNVLLAALGHADLDDVRDIGIIDASRRHIAGE
mmetsp:Transcript_43868/g.133592  ORF Transcript_43868/g.133592 Transcript_43868/m.133592 type:complete len:214 (-) Transcript_43868:1805-2446(-)